MNNHYEIKMPAFHYSLDCDTVEEAKDFLWDYIQKDAIQFEERKDVTIWFSGSIKIKGKTVEEAKNLVLSHLLENFADTAEVKGVF